ncbi:FliM/FliN family flagellar motor switch protein [Terriglobus sp.]|uniref:FliM/FliN family flagellar motor switch protein n=1 Tax=Terriglobus sp. TaxID=1889013 RepID=UPI003B0024F1
MIAADRVEGKVAAVEAISTRLGHVPLRLSADLPLPPLSMRALRDLQPGRMLTSEWSVADDLLLTLGGAPLCWGRFAAVDGRMVLRVVRLA